MTKPQKKRGATASSAPETNIFKSTEVPANYRDAKLVGPGGATAPGRGVPKAMREAKRWVLWAYKPGKKPGKRDKVPTKAGWIDEANWLTFDEACAARKSGQGLGFVLGGPWVGIDVDGAWDVLGDLSEHATLVWDACKGAYVEKSPSGKGFKVFLHLPDDAPRAVAKTPPIEGESHVGIECYPSGRWFAVTGNKLDGCGSDVRNPKAVHGWGEVLRHVLGSKNIDRVRHLPADAMDSALSALRRHTPELEQDLRAALALLPSDDYGEWVRFAIAMRAMQWQNNDAAFDLCYEWPPKSWSYHGEDDCRAKWESCSDARSDVKVSAIFARAKEVADALGMPKPSRSKLAEQLLEPLPLRHVPLKELIAMNPKIRLPVPGLLAPGLTLLQGRQKGGKTYMALQLAAALATGREFLGVKPARAYRVKLYALEEGGEPDLQAMRFKQMKLADWFVDDEQMKYLDLRFGDLPPLDGEGLERLKHDLQEFDLVIVGSATVLEHGTNGRKELDVFKRHYREMQVLQKIARQTGKCLLLLAHTRKGSTVERGWPDDVSDSTGGKLAAVDAYIVLQECEKVRGLWRLTVRGRYSGMEPKAVQHNKDTGHWECLGDWDQVYADALAGREVVPAKEKKRTCAEDVVESIGFFDSIFGTGVPTHNIVDHLARRYARPTVMAALRSLADSGAVVQSADGSANRSGMGRPGSLWSLAQ